MKTHNWRLLAWFVFMFTGIGDCQIQPNTVPDLQGELRGRSETIYHGYVIELESLGSQGERLHADVQIDGAFRMRNVPTGDYRLRVTNYAGEVVQEDLVTLSPQNPSLLVQLREGKSARPPSGSVSIKSLMHPPDAKAVKALGEAQKLSVSKKYPEALEKVQEALRISPDYPEAWSYLGAEHLRLRQYEQAIPEVSRALDLAGPNSVDLCNLAVAQWGLHRYPQALESAMKGAQLNPESDKAQYLVGALLVNTNRWKEAMPHLKYAARTMPAAQQILDEVSAKQAFLP